mmetsp:Transcript_82425/g.266965  ORF Transcript_82425/g.266965 Transcript_82425/m.266965 type:complete len:227 (-) Transcript_82425:760-1440(-)
MSPPEAPAPKPPPLAPRLEMPLLYLLCASWSSLNQDGNSGRVGSTKSIMKYFPVFSYKVEVLGQKRPTGGRAARNTHCSTDNPSYVSRPLQATRGKTSMAPVSLTVSLLKTSPPAVASTFVAGMKMPPLPSFGSLNLFNSTYSPSNKDIATNSLLPLLIAIFAASPQAAETSGWSARSSRAATSPARAKRTESGRPANSREASSNSSSVSSSARPFGPSMAATRMS